MILPCSVGGIERGGGRLLQVEKDWPFGGDRQDKPLPQPSAGVGCTRQARYLRNGRGGAVRRVDFSL